MCAYCDDRAAVNMDHVIPKAVYKRLDRWGDLNMLRLIALVGDRDLLDTVPSCFDCNNRKGTRLLIPPGWEPRLDDLNALNIGTFRVWDGSIEALREVVR